MTRFSTAAPLHRFSSPFTDAHVFYRCTNVQSIHKSAFRKQGRTLFTGSHVHTSFSCVCLIHRRANILQVKHHVSWFTSRSSIASSNVHISFTLADPVQTVPPMQFIPAYHFHKCKPCSQVHIHFLHKHAVQLFKCAHPAIRRNHF